jgi:hypothetical protein
MIKLHVALWKIVAGATVLGTLGGLALRGRSLKSSLERHLMGRRHPRSDMAVRGCPA